MQSLLNNKDEFTLSLTQCVYTKKNGYSLGVTGPTGPTGISCNIPASISTTLTPQEKEALEESIAYCLQISFKKHAKMETYAKIRSDLQYYDCLDLSKTMKISTGSHHQIKENIGPKKEFEEMIKLTNRHNGNIVEQFRKIQEKYFNNEPIENVSIPQRIIIPDECYNYHTYTHLGYIQVFYLETSDIYKNIKEIIDEQEKEKKTQQTAFSSEVPNLIRICASSDPRWKGQEGKVCIAQIVAQIPI